MTKGERIKYAVQKAVSEYSFREWLEVWDIKKEDWEKFMTAGKEALPQEESEEYQTASEMRDYCEEYEPTYNSEDGSM